MGRRLIHLHYRIFPEDNLWVGECVELGVSTSAESRDAVKKGIDEATRLYLATVTQHGELDHILQERGIPVFMDGEKPLDEIEDHTLPLPVGVA